MTVSVRIPHGLTWCADGRTEVEMQGTTLGEVWSNLHAALPELMWRLSLEQGPPSFWVRITIDGAPVDHPPCMDTAVADRSEMALHILPGSGAATGAASGTRVRAPQQP